MQRDEITAANRSAWNEAAPYHRKYTFDKVLENFKNPDFNTLGPLKSELFSRLSFKDKAIVQIACNNGRDLVSLKRLGAARCVGFDISDAFIDQGRRLAEAARVECEFVAADAYALPSTHDGQFDIVFISSGTVRWMPDLPSFFGAIARLLRPAGHLLLLEMHPILQLISARRLAKGEIAFHRSYFQPGPFIEREGLDYYGNEKYEATPAHSFHHKLSDLFNACSKSGLPVAAFEELPYDLSGGAYHRLEQGQVGWPLSYCLLAQKAR